MRFFSLIASAALAAVAVAQSPVRITNNGIAPKVGETLVITYEPATASVTLILKNGPEGNLQDVETIGTSSSGSISWTVKNVPNVPYALEIKPASGQSNYVGPFRIAGASASASSSASSASSTASSSGSVTRSSGSSSASASVSASTNGTVTSATLSPSASSATTSGSRPTGSAATQTTGSAPPTNTNAAGALSQSPLALVFGALAAFAYLA